MRLFFPAVFALAAGCATAGGVATSPSATTPAVLTDEHGKVFRTTDAPAATTVNVGPAEAIKAFAAGYEAAGVTPDVVDPGQRIVARSAISFSRTLKGDRLSEYFDCGDGQFGPRADDGRISASLTTRVSGDAAPVTVTTQVEAYVQLNEGTSSGKIRCGSRGTLEERIRRAAFRQLGLPEPTRSGS
jgi:hypothetical protein